MTPDQPRQNRRALIIGIDKYPNLSERSQLEGCVRDAREGRPPSGEAIRLPEQPDDDAPLRASGTPGTSVGGTRRSARRAYRGFHAA